MTNSFMSKINNHNKKKTVVFKKAAKVVEPMFSTYYSVFAIKIKLKLN